MAGKPEQRNADSIARKGRIGRQSRGHRQCPLNGCRIFLSKRAGLINLVPGRRTQESAPYRPRIGPIGRRGGRACGGAAMDPYSCDLSGHDGVVSEGTAIRETCPGAREASPVGVACRERGQRCPVYRGEFERLRHVAISFHQRPAFHCRLSPPNGQ